MTEEVCWGDMYAHMHEVGMMIQFGMIGFADRYKINLQAE